METFRMPDTGAASDMPAPPRTTEMMRRIVLSMGFALAGERFTFVCTRQRGVRSERLV